MKKIDEKIQVKLMDKKLTKEFMKKTYESLNRDLLDAYGLALLFACV